MYVRMKLIVCEILNVRPTLSKLQPSMSIIATFVKIRFDLLIDNCIAIYKLELWYRLVWKHILHVLCLTSGDMQIVEILI